MKKRPLLSVIVANFNCEAYLAECLESVLSQSYKEIEIVIYDDGSSDGSPKIIEKYAARYPDVVEAIFSPQNRGAARARHEAILQARGDYFTTLDSDDYYIDPRKLEGETALILDHRTRYEKEIAAFSGILFVDAQKNPIQDPGVPLDIRQGMIFEPLLTRSCLIPRDFTLKRSLYFEAGGYDFAFKMYEDWDLKLRIARRYEFYYTGIQGIAYRRHGRGLSSAPIPVHIKYLKRAFEKNVTYSRRPIKEVKKQFRQLIRQQKRRLKSLFIFLKMLYWGIFQ